MKDVKKRIRNIKKEIKNVMTKATEAHTIQNDSFTCCFLKAQNSHAPARRRAYNGNGKGKVHPRTGHEGPEGEYMYSSTPSLTSTLDGVAGQHHAPAALTPVKRPGTYHTGGCVVSTAGLEGCGIARPTGIRSPDRPAHSQSLYRLI